MTETVDMQGRTEIRDGMLVTWDVGIEMDDGIVMRADVYRPIGEGCHPVLVSYGPYGKGLAFQDLYRPQWDWMVDHYPDVAAGSTNLYQSWEVVDPEKWVPDGYACVRVDSRGTGMSPGFVDVWSPRETRDFYDCIEWAGIQAWSNGKVGLAGISYYAMNQYQVAALQPPHLAAICPWEGSADWYREFSYHGGIRSQFAAAWYPKQVSAVQHGVGSRGFKSPVTGEWVAGAETLPEDLLATRRADLAADIERRPLMDAWYTERNPDWSKVTVPMLSAANWGGQGLHPRGNIEAFVQAASEQKWLEVHGSAHWALFYTDYGNDLQKRFFDHFLKGTDSGWANQPPVQLQVRHVDGSFVERHEASWPLAGTQWTRYYLNPAAMSLDAEVPAVAESVGYGGLGDGVTFTMPPPGAGDGDNRPDGGHALRRVVDRRCGPVPDRAGPRPRRRRSDVHGRPRPEHADRPGLASSLPSQGRSRAISAISPLLHPRRGAAAEARNGVRGRRRDLAELHRRPRRVSHRADDPGEGLRVRGRTVRVREVLPLCQPGSWAVPAQRSRRPPGRRLRWHGHAPLRPGAFVAPAPACDPRREVSRRMAACP